jgi:hypothetical protein
MSNGRPPSSSHELQHYFDTSPREIFAAVDGAAANMPPLGNDGALAAGYVFLLLGLLLHLRYRIDRGYADSGSLVADFQKAMAARANEGSIDSSLLAMVAGALQQASIPAAPS